MNAQLPEEVVSAAFNPPPVSPSTTSNSPRVVTASPPPIVPPTPPIGYRKKWLIILPLLLLFLVILSGGSLSVLIAYEKVSLGDPSLQTSLSNLVQGLPFTPKTPKYILTRAIQSYKNNTKYKLDLSLATQVESLPLPINSTQLDLSLKGSVDYTDLKNPQVLLNITFTKDFSADLVVKNKITYFKIDQIPSYLTLFLNLDEAKLKPILNKWYYVDASPLETKARKQIEIYQSKNKEPQIDKKMEKALVEIAEEEVLPLFTRSSDIIDGFPTYKFHLDLSKEKLDRVLERLTQTFEEIPADAFKNTKPSDVIETLSLDLWVDKKEYYLRQISMPISIKIPKESLSPMGGFSASDLKQNSFQIVMVAKFSDFGKPVSIEVPSDITKIEELYKEVQKWMSPPYSPSSPSSSLVNPSLSGSSSLISPPLSGSSPQTSLPMPSSSVSVNPIVRSRYVGVKSSLAELQGAIDRYYATKTAFPKSVSDLIAAGEIKSTFPARLEEDQIIFKVNQEASRVFIYTLTPDPDNSTKPYLGVEYAKDSFGNMKNYTKEEITTIENTLAGEKLFNL